MWVTDLTEDLFLDLIEAKNPQPKRKPSYSRLCCISRPFKEDFDASSDGNDLYVVNTRGEVWKLNRPIDELTPAGVLEDYVEHPDGSPTAITVEKSLDKVFGVPDPDIRSDRVSSNMEAIVYDTKNNRSWWRKNNKLLSADTKTEVDLIPVADNGQKSISSWKGSEKYFPKYPLPQNLEQIDVFCLFLPILHRNESAR